MALQQMKLSTKLRVKKYEKYRILQNLLIILCQAILYIRSLPQMEKKDFQTVFPDANPLGKYCSMQILDFILTKFSNWLDGEDVGSWWRQTNQCSSDSDTSILRRSNYLQFYVEKLKLCFALQYADPTDEPTAPFYDQTFEDYDLTVDVWKGTLLN